MSTYTNATVNASATPPNQALENSLTSQTNNFTPRMITVPADGTMTRLTLQGWTRTQMEDMGFYEVGLDKEIGLAKEAKMVGVEENALHSLLLSRTVPFREGKGGPYTSMVQPFRYVPRRTQVNANFFTITAGEAEAGGDGASYAYNGWAGSGAVATPLTRRITSGKSR